jgi:cytidylate kinase
VIIAIDGPAGSGKSSTARAVARRLGFRHLDSGAFYRALTFVALADELSSERWAELTGAELDRLDISARPSGEGFHLYRGGQDITGELRRPEVNAHVSEMARVPAVRDWLLAHLREAARGSDVVVDGRDIGTVVFPDAELKIFLVADPEVRARRRLAEYQVTEPTPAELAAEVERLLQRDRIDSERDVAPLKEAPDAVRVDTSGLTFEEQVGRIVEWARLISSGGAAPAKIPPS